MKTSRKKHRMQKPIFYSEDYGFLGHLIYSERKIQGIRKAKILLDLNLSTYIVENLETGHLNRTPGVSYMIGFLRTYAKYLGLDAQEIVQCVKPQNMSVFEEEPVLKVPLQQRQLPTYTVLWGAVLVLILVLVGYSSSISSKDQLSPLQAIKLNDLSTHEVYPSEELMVSIQQFLDIYHKPFLSPESISKTF